MKLKFYSVEKLKREILEILGKYLDISEYKVFFFGSRAEGTLLNERSDIDVGIEGKEPIPARIWLDIQEDIERIPTLYKIEIVDFRRAADVFRQVALQHTELIYPPAEL